MCYYSPKCIDERAGFTITDPKTGRTYSDEEAHQQPKEIKSRLVQRPNKLGAWVACFKTLEMNREENERLQNSENE